MRTNVIASLEEIRLRTKLAPVEHHQAATFRQCSHTVDGRSAPIDPEENRRAGIMLGAHGLTSTY